MKMDGSMRGRRVAAGNRTSRRELLLGLAGSVVAAAALSDDAIIDTHVELLASDKTRFPLHPHAPEAPPRTGLGLYRAFVRRSRLRHAVLVQPEAYQDDHRFLEHCFANEPAPGFFKGVCLLDPLASDAVSNLEKLMAKNPGRIAAVRIIASGDPGLPPSAGGPIRNRDFQQAGMKALWHKAHEAGLAMQLDFDPGFAGKVYSLAVHFQAVPVILNFFGRPGAGTMTESDELMHLARLPKSYLQLSGLQYLATREPDLDRAKLLLRRAYYTFGPDRILWGGLGRSSSEFQETASLLESLLEDIPEADRDKIRALNAMRLYGFTSEAQTS